MEKVLVNVNNCIRFYLEPSINLCRNTLQMTVKKIKRYVLFIHGNDRVLKFKVPSLL